jgi:hypothetical protein
VQGRQGQFPARQLVDRSYICLRTTLRARRGSDDELAENDLRLSPPPPRERDGSIALRSGCARVDQLARTYYASRSITAGARRPAVLCGSHDQKRTNLMLLISVELSVYVHGHRLVAAAPSCARARPYAGIRIIFSRWPRQAYISSPPQYNNLTNRCMLHAPS